MFMMYTLTKNVQLGQEFKMFIRICFNMGQYFLTIILLYYARKNYFLIQFEQRMLYNINTGINL